MAIEEVSSDEEENETGREENETGREENETRGEENETENEKQQIEVIQNGGDTLNGDVRIEETPSNHVDEKGDSRDVTTSEGIPSSNEVEAMSENKESSVEITEESVKEAKQEPLPKGQ